MGELQAQCGFSDQPLGHIVLREEELKTLFAEKFKAKASTIKITISNETPVYIRGTVDISDPQAQNPPGKGATFLAKKEDGGWSIVFDGRGIIACDQIRDEGFPESMIEDCQDIEPSPGIRGLKEEATNYIEKGSLFSVALESNPTTGYEWEVDFDSVYIQLVKEEYQPLDPELIGGRGTHAFIFLALDQGETKIRFRYWRPWEGEDSVVETKEFEVAIR